MEGILLDDVYTAKAAAGLIDYAANGRFAAQDNILFIHTGGNTGLYY
jgi:L-cysteate sulfo-lyase